MRTLRSSMRVLLQCQVWLISYKKSQSCRRESEMRSSRIHHTMPNLKCTMYTRKYLARQRLSHVPIVLLRLSHVTSVWLQLILITSRHERVTVRHVIHRIARALCLDPPCLVQLSLVRLSQTRIGSLETWLLSTEQAPMQPAPKLATSMTAIYPMTRPNTVTYHRHRSRLLKRSTSTTPLCV